MLALRDWLIFGGLPSLPGCLPVHGSVAAGETAEGRIFNDKGPRPARGDSRRIVIRTAAESRAAGYRPLLLLFPPEAPSGLSFS